jgi:hypothetical protein
LPDGAENGDAWLGVFKSFDGGQTWRSTLIPGYPQDESPIGKASPLKGYQAAADPTVRPGTNGLFYYSGIAFDRGDNGKSAVFVSRFIDNNNLAGGDPIAYLGTIVVDARAPVVPRAPSSRRARPRRRPFPPAPSTWRTRCSAAPTPRPHRA